MKLPILAFRTAAEPDLEAIVALLADDSYSQERNYVKSPLPESYRAAFHAISSNPDIQILVADVGGEVAGVLQISFTPHLTHGGSWRATVEGVRVAANLRGRGIGSMMMRRAITLAVERDCKLVQLTTNAERTDARRFYEALGFAASHIGMKLYLRTT